MALMTNATIPYTIPAKKLPTIAPSGPPIAVAEMIGAIKAKDDPK